MTFMISSTSSGFVAADDDAPNSGNPSDTAVATGPANGLALQTIVGVGGTACVLGGQIGGIIISGNNPEDRSS